MRPATFLALLSAVVALPAVAQIVVPVEQAPYHVPVFTNEYVTVLDVHIPPGRTSGFHRHALDTFGVQIVDTPRTGQIPGAEPTPTSLRAPGAVQFARYGGEPYTHAVSVARDGAFHNVVVELLQPHGYGFETGSRDGAAGYTQVLDNERVRAWRLVLAPDETAAAITQSAPGIRIVVRGGDIVERIAERPDRGIAPRAGDFFWQNAGTTRTVRNIGTTTVELVEFEIK